jgi:hypothetical protein
VAAEGCWGRDTANLFIYLGLTVEKSRYPDMVDGCCISVLQQLTRHCERNFLTPLWIRAVTRNSKGCSVVAGSTQGVPAKRGTLDDVWLLEKCQVTCMFYGLLVLADSSKLESVRVKC